MKWENLNQFIVEEKNKKFKIKPDLTEIIKYIVVDSKFCPCSPFFYETNNKGEIILSDKIPEKYRSVIAFHEYVFQKNNNILQALKDELKKGELEFVDSKDYEEYLKFRLNQLKSIKRYKNIYEVEDLKSLEQIQQAYEYLDNLVSHPLKKKI